jgi:hypothetical protein
MPVADFVFLGRFHFGQCLVFIRHVKYRVIAESVTASFFMNDFAFDSAFSDMLVAVGVDKRHDRAKASSATGGIAAFQLFQ